MRNNLLSPFFKIADRFPEKIAATDSNASITYQNLKEDSLRIVTAFQQCNFQEKKVGIYIPNGINALVALVGSLHSGICFSVLDTKQPSDRNRMICSIGMFDYVITQNNLLEEAIQFFDRNKILILEELLKQEPADHHSLADVAHGTPAILFFTSGSTGIPKGVVHTHQRLSEGQQYGIEYLGISPSDRFDMIVPLGFTASIFVYFSLLQGASLHFFDVRKKGIIAYVNFLLRNKINFSVMTVSAFRGVVKLSTLLGKLKHFRILYLVGEPVQPSDIVLFRKHCPKDASLVNVYGSTETRIVSMNRFDYQDTIPEKVSAGLPFGKVQIYILDEELCVLPPGVTGQIAVSSPYMATGYFNNETETRNSFLVHQQLNKLLYLTGDIGYLSEDGHLFHQGRNDFMVKVRGNRVDLFEIESCLLQHPDIADVAVINKGSSFVDSMLVAYCELKNEVSLLQLRMHIADKLPEYMVPTYFIKTDKLPKTSTGKTDRKTLMEKPLDYTAILGVSDQNQLEFDPLYQKLKAIWMEELKIPRLSPDHNFFDDLGGDSILAVSVLERMRNDLDIHLPYFILFRYRTLGRLTEYIHRSGEKLVSIDPLQNPGNEQSPVIIFVPPIKGGVDTYNFALKSFPADYGLFTLTYNIIDDDNKEFYPLDKIMGIAAELIDNSGFTNLFLFGYSMGGLLAFEIAQRTLKGRIKKLIIIDIPPAKKKKINLFYFMANDIRLSWRGLLKGKIEPLKVNLKHILFCLPYFFIRDNRIRKFENMNHQSLAEASHLRYYIQCDHQKFDGDLLLIHSTESIFKKGLFKWEKYVAGDIQTRKIDSGHYDILHGNKSNIMTGMVVDAIK